MIPIHIVLKKFITENLDNEEFVRSYLRALWRRIVGNTIAQVTTISDLRGTTLLIDVYEQEWLKVLVQMEKELKDKINSVLPKPVIEHIDFKKSRRVYRLKNSEDLKNKDADSQESLTPKEAELITDSELKEHFKKAYKHRQRIKFPKA